MFLRQMFPLEKNAIHLKLKWWFAEILQVMHGELIHQGKEIYVAYTMPDGMKENDFFPSPIITPSTKAEAGT